MIQALAAEKYVLVTSFRKDGTPVPTPVWAAVDGDVLVAWTVAGSGKVKRIGNNPEVTITACDLRGNPRGEAIKGRAEVLSAEETERVRSLLKKKYGLQGRLAINGSLLRRGRAGTVGLRISPVSG